MTQKSQDKMSEIDEHITKRFDIKKRLGKGAYGIVWKAIDRKSGEIIAVKKIFDAFQNQTDSQRTFREIMFLQSFRNHPNIIQLHSIHRATNNRDIYLGFEYMDTDLHMVIKRGNILRDCHKRFIMYQLFNATKYIHSGNVIHRDQKPSNVLLDQHCRCKVADFGLARSLTQNLEGGPHSDSDPTLTDYVATRWYRAPEILIASRRYTKGIDMWSLGCILAEMLAGKPIFPGTSTVNQVERIMATIPVPTPEGVTQLLYCTSLPILSLVFLYTNVHYNMEGRDIATVCSGIGTSMIKNATHSRKTSFANLLGHDCPNDALDLIHKLLVFNPNNRLTAEQALHHVYVSTYRNRSLEISMDRNIVPPLNDDVRLSIDDYRNKLYELMSHNIVPKRTASLKRTTIKYATEPRKPELVKVRSSPMPPRDNLCEKTFKHPNPAREKTYAVQSDTKIRYGDSRAKLAAVSMKSESRIPTVAPRSNIIFQGIVPRQRNSIGDLRATEVRHSPVEIKEKTRKKIVNVKTNVVYSSPFNSYNTNHGIITASALRELKSGVR